MHCYRTFLCASYRARLLRTFSAHDYARIPTDTHTHLVLKERVESEGEGDDEEEEDGEELEEGVEDVREHHHVDPCNTNTT